VKKLLRLNTAHFSVSWSVCLSVVRRLSHSCTLLKPFDGFRCHLAGKLLMTHCVRRRSLIPRRKSQKTGRFGGSNHQPKHAITNCSQTVYRQSYVATRRIRTKSWVDLPQQFRILPKYCGFCLIVWILFKTNVGSRTCVA